MTMTQEAIQTLTLLAVDAVNQANSGHPGMPMGAAAMAYTLFADHLRFSPSDPKWPGRDRFILSAGHASALQYGLLHLFGYDLTLDDLRRFRQLHSKTPGHPEYGQTDGVEMTTGPLGQGFATAVGFAMAQKRAEAVAGELFKHKTYVICSDGDLMEGISYEAAALAGQLKLNNLIVLYDSNGITIDGSTELTFSESISGRFEAQNWKYLLVEDGHDPVRISEAIKEAKKNDRPTLVEVRTVIGKGSSKEGTSATHGAPLGEEEARCIKEKWGRNPDKTFDVSSELRAHLQGIIDRKEAEASEWKKAYAALSNREEIEAFFGAELPEDITAQLLKRAGTDKATRAHGAEMLQGIREHLPNLFGGSADLAGSNLTTLKGDGFFSDETPDAANVHFGIREHAMAAAANGISLYGGFKPFTATFLSFADYMKPSIRLAALMEISPVYIFTHDSLGVGEDGPTHQPIEQMLMLRSIPGFTLYRPADAKETAAAYAEAFSSATPCAVVMTRQKLPELDIDVSNAHKGGYIVKKEKGEKPELILMASGSELHLALFAAEALEQEVDIRVVSMLSMEVFERQGKEYKEEVLPMSVRKRFAVEAASALSWHRYIGLDGGCRCMDRFGASAPGNQLFELFGFTVESLVEELRSYMEIK
ncbi:MAG: transketolase [Tissierellia bacterium]|nr:transketolase [Tissierellia bacterium]